MVTGPKFHWQARLEAWCRAWASWAESSLVCHAFPLQCQPLFEGNFTYMSDVSTDVNSSFF
jgi:hypothetical protein